MLKFRAFRICLRARDKNMKFRCGFQYAFWKNNEEIRLHPLPFDFADTCNDGLDRYPLNIEENGVADREFEVFGDSLLNRHRIRLLVVFDFSDPLTSNNFLSRDQMIAIGRTIFAPQGPSGLIAFGIVHNFRNGNSVQRLQTHCYNRNILQDRQIHRFDYLVKFAPLIVLHIEQNHRRPISLPHFRHLPKQKIARKIKSKNQKRAEPESEHQQYRAIIRPMKIRQTLPPNIGPAPRRKSSDRVNKDQRYKRQSEKSDRKSAGKSEAGPKTSGLQDRKTGSSDSDQCVNHPAKWIAPTLFFKLFPTSDRAQRRNSPDCKKRQQRENNTDRKSDDNSLKNGIPRYEDAHFERQKVLHHRRNQCLQNNSENGS